MREEFYWSRYASIYDEGVDYVVGRDLRLAVAARLSRERRLGEALECGCGTGFYTKTIAAHADWVTATDISDDMLALAAHNLASTERISFRKTSAERTPFPPRTFDTALLANLLNTVAEPLRVLREIYRVLKYDGMLIVVVYTDYDMEPGEKLDLGLRYFQKFGMPPTEGLHNFSPQALRGLVRQAGFLVKSVRVLGDNPKALYSRSVKSVMLEGSNVRP